MTPKFKIGELAIEAKGPYLHPEYAEKPSLIVGFEEIPADLFLRLEGYLAYRVLNNEEILVLEAETFDKYCKALK